LKLDNYRQSIKSQHFFYFLSTFQGVSLYPRNCFGILQFCICLGIWYKIIGVHFFIYIILYLFYVSVTRESPSAVVYDVSLLKTLRVHALETPGPYHSHSGDCNQTWPGSGTRRCAGFSIFAKLWQNRGLENKVQIWLILSCVVRGFLYPNICH